MARYFSKPTSQRRLSSNLSPECICPRLVIRTSQAQRRNFRSQRPLLQHQEYIPQQPRYPRDQPRWKQTPPLMTAPYRSKPPVEGNDFIVNEDPAKLDEVYANVLGNEQQDHLTDEAKWLAVTHKSFDHGRRGFNDRLSLIGRTVYELQVSLALVQGLTGIRPSLQIDQHPRQPFEHQALSRLNVLTEENKRQATDRFRLADLARKYGLHRVIRWKPRNAQDLNVSGIDLVLQQALYAIIGAVSLQKGGQVANKIAQDRILRPLGLYRENSSRY